MATAMEVDNDYQDNCDVEMDNNEEDVAENCERRVVVIKDDEEEDDRNSPLRYLAPCRRDSSSVRTVRLARDHVTQRLGYWSDSRKRKYHCQDGMTRDCDWREKLKKPRMGMVADMVEDSLAVTRDVNENMIDDEHDGSDDDEDTASLIFTINNDDKYERDSDSESSSDSEYSSDNQQFASYYQSFQRKFHFKPKEYKDKHTEVNSRANDDEEHSTAVIDKIVELKEIDKKLNEIAVRKEIDKKNDAIKKLDKQLLDIEYAKRRKLKEGMKNQRQVLSSRSNPQSSRASKRVDYSSSSSDSSSSSSSSDSSDSSDDSSDEEQTNTRTTATKETRNSPKKEANKALTKEKRDLKDKLKNYLSKKAKSRSK